MVNFWEHDVQNTSQGSQYVVLTWDSNIRHYNTFGDPIKPLYPNFRDTTSRPRVTRTNYKISLQLLLVDFPPAHGIHTKGTSASWLIFAATGLESVSGYGLGGLASLSSLRDTQMRCGTQGGTQDMQNLKTSPQQLLARAWSFATLGASVALFGG